MSPRSPAPEYIQVSFTIFKTMEVFLLFSTGFIVSGGVLLGISVIMIIAGLVSCVYTVKYSNQVSEERRQVSHSRCLQTVVTDSDK